jgi:hypothetical protein
MVGLHTSLIFYRLIKSKSNDNLIDNFYEISNNDQLIA